MKSIKRTLRLYLPFSKAGVKVELAYKAQIVMWLIISLIETIFVAQFHKIGRVGVMAGADGVDIVLLHQP